MTELRITVRPKPVTAPIPALLITPSQAIVLGRQLVKAGEAVRDAERAAANQFAK